MISIVIPALNAEACLSDQLDALAAQTYQGESEILICDNGSVDGTRELVAARQGVDPSIRLIDASGQPGCGYARNIGVEHAEGDVVAFCDADDVVAPNWVEAMADASIVHDVVVGRLETELLNPRWTQIARPVTEGLEDTEFLPSAHGGNLAIRKEAFLAVGGFAPQQKWLEDTDFSWRLQLAGYELAYEPKALIHVRLRRSLQGIYRQGFVYGEALAQLKDRYSVSSAVRPDGEAVSTSKWKTGVQLLSVLAAKPGRGSLGHVLWQVGWHLGHRAGKRPGTAVESQLPLPLPQPPILPTTT